MLLNSFLYNRALIKRKNDKKRRGLESLTPKTSLDGLSINLQSELAKEKKPDEFKKVVIKEKDKKQVEKEYIKEQDEVKEDYFSKPDEDLDEDFELVQDNTEEENELIEEPNKELKELKEQSGGENKDIKKVVVSFF
jgi:hypothetical protein